MEPAIVRIQALVLRSVGLGWLAIGLWLGQDPATVAWRAALGTAVAVMVSGNLLRYAAAAIQERVADDLAQRELAATTPPAKPAKAA